MASCCTCCKCPSGQGSVQKAEPFLCLVPRSKLDAAAKDGSEIGEFPTSASTPEAGHMGIMDEEYVKKHFNLPNRALYLDAFRRPLISFPMGQEGKNFNMARKNKINQQILDGILDASEAIVAPSVFPFAKTASETKQSQEESELIYILQLPDWEFHCPIHNETIRTPRFIWHSCKKSGDQKKAGPKPGGGPMNRPKPWLLSRNTDFDFSSQW